MATLRCQCNQSIQIPGAQFGSLFACPNCQTHLRAIAAIADDNASFAHRLIIEAGPERIGEHVHLGGNRPLTVGKTPTAHLRLRSNSVSREHFKLVPAHGRWHAMDQSSTNGLFVNNRQIQSHELCNGDRLTVGEFTLTFVASDSESSASGLTGAAAIASGHESFGEFELEQTAATPSVDGENLTFVDDDLNTRPVSTPADSDLKCPRCSEHLSASASICIHCGHDRKSGRRIAPVSIEESDSARKGKLAHIGGIGSYLKSCAGSAIFVADAGNLISFIFVMILAAMNAGVDMLTFHCLMWIPYIIIKGLLAAFFFNVVINASSGDTDLPDIGLSGDMYEDMIAPFFKMLATSLIVMSPLYVYMLNVGITQVTTLGIAVTLGIGVFFWPITMLVIALGGVSCFARPDQILLTVFRTFVPYLVTCLVLALAIGMTWVLEFAMESATAALGGNKWAVATILWIVNVYCFIVAMQCIGLYYHHFKDRFAWSWG